MSAGQHKLWHGKIAPLFTEKMGIEPTKENVAKVKKMFKDYLSVPSTAALTDTQYSHFISAAIMIMSREFGIDVMPDTANRTMEQLLNTLNDEYDNRNQT